MFSLQTLEIVTNDNNEVLRKLSNGRTCDAAIVSLSAWQQGSISKEANPDCLLSQVIFYANVVIG
jgi:hypothetical protein